MANYGLKSALLAYASDRICTVPFKGEEWYPQIKAEYEALLLDNMSITANYVDDVHPRIIASLQKEGLGGLTR